MSKEYNTIKGFKFDIFKHEGIHVDILARNGSTPLDDDAEFTGFPYPFRSDGLVNSKSWMELFSSVYPQYKAKIINPDSAKDLDGRWSLEKLREKVEAKEREAYMNNSLIK